MRLIVFVLIICLASCAGDRRVVFTPKNWPVEVPGTVFKPKTKSPAPAILLIHGGVKIGKDGRWVMNGIAGRLARRGYYVLNITYRDGAEWPYPAPLDDVEQGIRWLKKNAASEGIDPNRIGVFGYSAGGYLGSLAALREDAGEIRAIVAGGTPTDLTVYANGVLVQGFLGNDGLVSMERFYDASPLTHVSEKSPPVFIYQGENDELVRPDHAEKFDSVLNEFNVPHEVYWIPEKGHITTFFFPSGAIDAAIDFLDKHMK